MYFLEESDLRDALVKRNFALGVVPSYCLFSIALEGRYMLVGVGIVRRGQDECRRETSRTQT